MAGYLTGSTLSGLIYDHVNHELAFAIVNLLEGVCTIAAPFAGQIGGLAAFISVMFVQAIGQGFVDAGLSMSFYRVSFIRVKTSSFTQLTICHSGQEIVEF